LQNLKRANPILQRITQLLEALNTDQLCKIYQVVQLILKLNPETEEDHDVKTLLARKNSPEGKYCLISLNILSYLCLYY
jgi:hypothetical protein